MPANSWKKYQGAQKKIRESRLYTKTPPEETIRTQLRQLARTSKCGHGEILHRTSTHLDTELKLIAPILEKLLKEEAIVFNKKSLNYELPRHY
jgi:hypothetical protein